MSLHGTAAYRTWEEPVPDRVVAAVRAADELGFELCVRPEIGRLLAALAGGLPDGALVGETGTGTGAGLAWMAAAAGPGVSLVSYELDPRRAAAAQRVHARDPRVEVVGGDAVELFGRGPFDLLVLDGGPGSGKRPGDRLVDPASVLRPGGTLTVDDFGPATHWPPLHHDDPDVGRLAVLEHPDLRTTEIRVAPDLAVLVGRYLPPR